MTILNILKYPEKSLLMPSEEVLISNNKIDQETLSLIDNMGETMFAAPGVGLAAPQIGVNKRIIVYDIGTGSQQSPEEEPKKEFKGLINPVIIKKSGSIVSENEGCLSVPDLTSNVKRYENVTVQAINTEGQPLEFEAEGIEAVVMQHEIDHLDGVLFFERISLLKKQMYKKRIAKKQKESEK